MLLPHAVLTVSLVTALLPSLARTAHAKDLTAVGADIEKALRTLSIIIIPIALMVLAHGKDIMLALFARGNANFVQTGISGLVLSAFALSLLPFTVFYLLSRAAYAQEDTKTPFYLTVVMNIVQLLVAAIFLLTTTRGYWVVGLAVGYSIGYLVAAIGMYLQLRKPLNLNLKLVAETAVHTLLLSIPSVLLSFVIVNFIDAWLPNSATYSLLQLVIALIIAASTFIGLNQFKPLAELAAVIKLVSRKNNG